MGNPYELTEGLYVDPNSQAMEWCNANPVSHMRWVILDKIARKAQAKWVGYGDVDKQIWDYLDAALAKNQLPQLVAYGIPYRDLGGESAGGAPDFKSYAKWIRSFAKFIGNQPAVVILEPDSIIHLGSMDPEYRVERLACLNYAVHVFNERCPNTFVYLDGGDGRWNLPDRIAHWLSRAGIAGARGFAVNVSNYNTFDTLEAFSKQVNAALAGYGISDAWWVYDSSRNGNGPDAQGTWCNPAGRKLGKLPEHADFARLDANLWVKRPGESDGNCGVGKGTVSGQFVPELAYNLYYGK